METNQTAPVWPSEAHWNEDPNSVPTPLSGGVGFLSSTQARYYTQGTSDLPGEPGGHRGPYLHNRADHEPKRISSEREAENAAEVAGLVDQDEEKTPSWPVAKPEDSVWPDVLTPEAAAAQAVRDDPHLAGVAITDKALAAS